MFGKCNELMFLKEKDYEREDEKKIFYVEDVQC